MKNTTKQPLKLKWTGPLDKWENPFCILHIDEMVEA